MNSRVELEPEEPKDLTGGIAEESKTRAKVLQALALNASQKLTKNLYGNYFIVSREFYSELFFGFLTNVPSEQLEAIVENRIGEAKGDFVGFFRDQYTKSFERPGPLKAMSDYLSTTTSETCSLIAVSFSWDGNRIGGQFFSSDFELYDDPDGTAVQEFLSKIKYDKKLHEMAKGLAIQQGASDGAKPAGDGYCLVVSADNKIGDEHSFRRRSVQLMQISLQIGFSFEDLENSTSLIDDSLIAALGCSRVAAYSVLYERERYFEKAIRQATKGTMIKWGNKDSFDEFRGQLEILNKCNDEKRTHSAPYVIKYGIKDETTHHIKNKDKETPYPWYEMVRYNLPSLDEILTTTPDLQNYEVRALAKSVFDHLVTHFWKQESDREANSKCFSPLPISAIPLLVFRALQRELYGNGDNTESGSIERIKKRIESWREGNPIRVHGKGLVISEKALKDQKKSLLLFFYNQGSDIDIKLLFDGHHDQSVQPVVLTHPDTQLDNLIQKWKSKLDHQSNIEVPKFLASMCHGDPHFENLFVDASIPEDAFIVAIDPTKRSYQGNPRDLGVDKYEKDAQDVIAAFGQQPIHDIAKLLLSTTGQYALIMKNGLSSALDHKTKTYSISWQSNDNTSQLGPDGSGASGANLFIRSASATREAKRYQYVFASEILRKFDLEVDKVLNRCEITDPKEKNICRNTYYLQIWAWVVRHTFSVAEKLFPDKDELSDQLFAFGYFLLQKGTDFLQANGPDCLEDSATKKYFEHLLTLHDIVSKNNEQ